MITQITFLTLIICWVNVDSTIFVIYLNMKETEFQKRKGLLILDSLRDGNSYTNMHLRDLEKTTTIAWKTGVHGN